MSVDSATVTIYQNLMDTIGNGLLMLDEKANISLANHWFNLHCEYEMKDKIGENFYSLFPELQDTRISDAIASTIEFGYPSIVSNLFTPTPFPLYSPKNFDEDHLEDKRILQQVTISRLEHFGHFYCLLHIDDISASVTRERILETEISDRKLIEDALLESDIKHLTIIEKMVDGLIVFDSKGLIESFNPASEALFDYSESSIIGINVNTLFNELTETRIDEDQKITINKYFIGFFSEIIAIKKDGNTFDAEVSVSEIRTSEKIFYTAIVHDITERKIVDKMKTEFISTVSHELRTPLTSIRGSLGLINGGVISRETEKAGELITVAYSNCDRLILLINDLLDMEKIASGGLNFELGKHELRALVIRGIDDNKSYADAYDVKYVLDAYDEDYNCEVDSHRFLQVISNLLSNAAKFSKKGDNVDVRLIKKDNMIEIQVQDYGDGIPDKFKDTIWNKFTQADASTTRKKGGTGLGLAISRSLTNSMGGDISFNSILGEGTTFILTFPVTEVS